MLDQQFSQRLVNRLVMLADSLPDIWTAVLVSGELLSADAIIPTAVLDAHGPVLAAVSSITTVICGGAIIYRYGGRLDDAVSASMQRPLVSALYGLMAYGIVVLLVGYAYSQLIRLAVAETALTVSVTLVAAGLVFSLGGLGFVVVGAWLADLVGATDPWIGLVGLGTVSALVWLLLPVSFGIVVWVAIASVGIGGQTRLWFHAGSVHVSQS
jgi:hypothetical protein